MRIFSKSFRQRLNNWGSPTQKRSLELWGGLVVACIGIWLLELGHPGIAVMVAGVVIFGFGLWGTIDAVYRK